jgi:coiled-coil domain-containing protein 63/114
MDSYEIAQLKNLILREISEKKELDEKIREIKEDFLVIKNEMGGLNATGQLQERYEKHIKILENRLDKANQKFNESIEQDKKLREEIDKLRKERFFFENIYKKLEKELEKLRKEISVNLEAAYESYEKRDRNQEAFENIKAQMMKKESEYAQILSSIANDLNIRNSRRRSMEMKENMAKNFRNEDNLDMNFKTFTKKIKSEQMETQNENLQEKLQNLQYKFQKLEEFTEQANVESFCKKFKKNAQKNFDLFLTISMISKQAKQLEKEIKDLEEEIEGIRRFKTGQPGIEKNALLNELKSKTQKLVQKQDKYENEGKKNVDEFKQIKNNLYNLFLSLECDKDVLNENKLLMENGVTENNSRMYLSEIESKLKVITKFLENDKMANEDYDYNQKGKNIDKLTKNPKQVADDMKIAFASMGKKYI